MVWLFTILLSISTVLGAEDEPKILKDASDFHGFPQHFTGLFIIDNKVPNAKYYWKKDGEVITEFSKPPFRGVNTKNLLPAISNKAQRLEVYEGRYQVFISTGAGLISGGNILVQFTYCGSFVEETEPETQDVPVGQATFLKCPKLLYPGRNFIYKWGKISGAGGTMFIPPSKHYIVLDDGTLFFSHLLEKHVKDLNEMQMSCGMEASVGQDNRFKWSRTVFMRNISTNFTMFGPKMVSPLPNRTFTEGETISMKCAATGNPLPTYTWTMVDDYNVETTIKDDDNGVEFEANNRILVFKSATRRNSGRYTCTATIGGKSDSVKGRLKFEEKPTWIEPLIQSVKPSILASHSWFCNATGYPQPTYSWYANATKLESKLGHYTVNGGRITFPKLLLENSGMYKCAAENEQDNIFQTAHLDVQAVKPTFKSNTGETTLFLKSDGILECFAKAAPPAVNTWTKDGIEINTSLPKYAIDGTSLVIKDVTKGDIGNYACTATNMYGSDVKKITVEVVGEITFVKEPKSVNVSMNQNAELECEAKGEAQLNTPIKYKWKYDGKELKYDQENSSILWAERKKTLVILNAKVSDSGVYECIAYIDKPSYAEKSIKATVNVKGPPEAPTNVKVNGGCDLLEAKVSWSVSRKIFSPIERFIIQSVTTFRGNQWQIIEENIPSNANEFVVKNLSPHAKYRFLVQAVNSIGVSDPSVGSRSEECQTPEKLPVICPNITAVAGKANELMVHWKMMDLIDQNGKDFKYRVRYRKTSPPNSAWESKNFTAITTNYSIPDAGYYQKWVIQIQGVNIVGGGPFCEVTSFSGQDAPKNAPKNFKALKIRSDYVVLAWDKTDATPGNIDGYKLRYWQVQDGSRRKRASDENLCDSQDNLCEKDIIGGARTSYRVDELLPAKTYNMGLLAYNSGGAGPVSSIEVTTSDGKPSEPTHVKVRPYAKYIKVSWKPPIKPNGVITHYKVTITGSYDKYDTVSSDKDFIIFSNLKPNTDHTITIEATTNKGYGKKKTIFVKTGNFSVPEKPKIPGAIGVGEDSVNVTFMEGDSKAGSLTIGFPEKFYTVYRKKGSDEELETEQQAIYENGGSQFVVIPDLDPAEEYEFATVAVNYVGKSERSDFNSTYPGVARPAALTSPVYKRDWFIALVVIVCLLLLILLIALLITRKHGERYPVGKREKKRAGILDDAEEPDTDAYPMKPPRSAGNGHKRQNSTGSFANKDPDRDSLDDYGEDKFGEDAASLIGEYNDDRNPSAAVEGPEFV